MSSGGGRSVLHTALALALGAGPANAQDGGRIRAELRELEQRLSSAAAKVSRANAQHFLAFASACRGYYLRGYGFVFVLPPRDLPRPPGLVVRRRLFAGPDQRRGERQEATPVVVGRPTPPPDPELAEFERHVAEMQRDADQEQAEAERTLEALMRRLAPPPPAIPARPVETPAPPEEPAPPPPPPAPEPFPTAPWGYWLEEQDTRPPDQVVADVRSALTAALAEVRARLTSLRADEVVAVTVDFVAGTPFLEAGPPVRSLVVRVRKQDLEERQAGRLSTEELGRRIEAIEY